MWLATLRRPLSQHKNSSTGMRSFSGTLQTLQYISNSLENILRYFWAIHTHRSVVQRSRYQVLENRTESMTPFYPFVFSSKSSGTRKCTDWWNSETLNFESKTLCPRCACWWTTRRTNRRRRRGSTTSWPSWSGSPGASPRTSLSTRSG